MTALSNTALSSAHPIRPLTDAEIDHVVGAYDYSGAQYAAYAMALDWTNTHGSGTVTEHGFMGAGVPSEWSEDSGNGAGGYSVVYWLESGGPMLHVGFVSTSSK